MSNSCCGGYYGYYYRDCYKGSCRGCYGGYCGGSYRGCYY